MREYLYHYKAKVVSVYDGDTITVDIELGFKHVMYGQKVRLFGIDTPEVRGVERPDGLFVRDYLRELILGKEVTIETIRDKTGKYGRWLALVWLDDLCINEHLFEEGLAETMLF